MMTQVEYTEMSKAAALERPTLNGPLKRQVTKEKKKKNKDSLIVRLL